MGGTATVAATENGGATVDLKVAGLTPGTDYQARLQAGSCDMPSASFGALGTLRADASGKATLSVTSGTASAGGSSMELQFAGVADGGHILSLAGQGVAVACGAIARPEASPQEQPGSQAGIRRSSVDWSLILTMPIALLAVLGAALVAAGVVAYRGSSGVWTRTAAAAAIAAGITIWALLLWITPVSVARGG